MQFVERHTQPAQAATPHQDKPPDRMSMLAQCCRADLAQQESGQVSDQGTASGNSCHQVIGNSCHQASGNSGDQGSGESAPIQSWHDSDEQAQQYNECSESYENDWHYENDQNEEYEGDNENEGDDY